MKTCSTLLRLAIVASVLATHASAGFAADACDATLGAQLFAMCSACHALSSTAPQREGPHLQGLFGRRAASVPQFSYSPALQSSQWIWNAELLDRWLTKPQRTLPGTTMTFVGLKSPAERAAVICYLEAATK